MSYVVKVKGYAAYWSGISEPGKVWTENVYDAQKFESAEDAEKIVNSGQNMECLNFDDVLDNPGIPIPDWKKIEVGVVEARKRMKPKGFAPEKNNIDENKKDLEEIDLTEDDFVEL